MLAQLAGGYSEFLEQAPVPSSTEKTTQSKIRRMLSLALLGLHRSEMNGRRELGQMAAKKHGTFVSTRPTDT